MGFWGAPLQHSKLLFETLKFLIKINMNSCYPIEMIVLFNIITLNTTTSKYYFQPLISRLNVGEGSFQDVPIQPTFLQVCVLGAGDSFVSSHSFHTSLVAGTFYLNFRLDIG